MGRQDHYMFHGKFSPGSVPVNKGRYIGNVVQSFVVLEHKNRIFLGTLSAPLKKWREIYLH